MTDHPPPQTGAPGDPEKVPSPVTPRGGTAAEADAEPASGPGVRGNGRPDGSAVPGRFVSRLGETRYFARFLEPIRGLVATIILVDLAAILLRLPITFIPQQLTLHFDDKPWLWTYLGLAMGAIIASGLMSLFGGHCSNRMAEHMARAMRLEVFARLERLSMLSVVSQGAGQFVQRTVRDVEQIRDLFRQTLTQLASQGIQALVIVCVMLVMEPLLTVILVAVFLLVGPFIQRVNYKVEELARRIQQLNEKSIDNMVEAVGGFRDIQVSGRFDRFYQRYENVTRETERTCVRAGLWAHIAGTFPTVVAGVLIVVPYFVALNRLNTVQGIGHFITYAALLGQLMPLFTQMARASSIVARATPAMRAVRMILSPPGDGAPMRRGMPGRPTMRGRGRGPGAGPPPGRRGGPPPDSEGTPMRGPGPGGPSAEPLEPHEVDLPIRAIEFDNVLISLGGRPILTDLNFHIPGGKFTAIVGESGSGKTTIFHLLVRLLEPDAGRIRINDVPLAAVPLEQLRRLIGFIPQNPFIFNQTLRENLLIASPEHDLDDALMARVVETAQLGEVIERRASEGGLDALAGHMGGKLSGGERQRIALGRLLIQDPQIIVCDEYTANIDVKTARVIDRTIHETFRDRTRVVITHELYTISGADHIIVLDDGTVVQTGRHDELIARPGLYKELWEVQTLAS